MLHLCVIHFRCLGTTIYSLLLRFIEGLVARELHFVGWHYIYSILHQPGIHEFSRHRLLRLDRMLRVISKGMLMSNLVGTLVAFALLNRREVADFLLLKQPLI